MKWALKSLPTQAIQQFDHSTLSLSTYPSCAASLGGETRQAEQKRRRCDLTLLWTARDQDPDLGNVLQNIPPHRVPHRSRHFIYLPEITAVHHHIGVHKVTCIPAHGALCCCGHEDWSHTWGTAFWELLRSKDGILYHPLYLEPINRVCRELCCLIVNGLVSSLQKSIVLKK